MSNSLNPANSLSGAAPSPQLATPESDADVSASLGKRFDILSRLAESDAHIIYSARDLSRSPVGQSATGLIRLKVLRPSLAEDNRQVELFRLEAGAAARLSHANILKTAEAEELNGVHFSVMEEEPYLITLRDHLDRRGWLNVEEAAQISRQIADALQHAHSRSILHLTLDPEKVLVDREGTAYVTGFGIDRAKDLLWARQERSRHCSARYIAPEQILSGEVDQRTDLYLLGLILFEMLTDRAPFESADLADLRSKHLARTPAPPHTFRPELSNELSQTVMDLLSKRPDGRPFYISAFKSALDHCVAAGLIAREQDEAAQESDSLPESTGGEQSFEADELAATGGVAIAVDEEFKDEEFKDKDYFDPPDSTDVDHANEFAEPDDEPGDSGLTRPDVIEIPLPAAREHERGEYYEQVAPVFLAEEPAKSKSRRLIWLMMLLLVAGGLCWAILAARSQGEPKPTASGAVADARSNDGAAAPNAEEPAPKAGPVNSGAAEALPPDSALANLVIEDASTAADTAEKTDAKKPEAEKSDTETSEPVRTLQPKPTGEAEAEKPSPPRRAVIAPPVTSTSVPVFTPNTDSPARVREYAPDNAQPREPAPAPQQAERSPALRTIRKSGDVLQNTAIVRPRPLYPKAARDSNVKGAVTVEVTIDEEGGVISARPISGPEPLRDAALAAARRWKWVPERVDRNRARVVGTITLSFKD